MKEKLYDKDLPESKKPKTKINLVIKYSIMCDKYSSWNKLIRIIAFIFRFVNNSCHRSKNREKHFGVLNSEELQQAIHSWCRIQQSENFAIEMSKLQRNKPLSKTSKLLCLALFIDEDRQSRIEGRLRHTRILTDKKHPSLLPKNHTATKLIANFLRVTYLHLGA